MLSLIAAFSFLLVGPGIRAAGVPRGVDPELIPRYAPDSTGSFACLDGLKRIPFSRVNDDYCDCNDGSDEPGTAACYNGHFYCRNKGHEPAKLSSSFVDDGICDCCDGTDELTNCPNTCLEKSSAQRQAMRASVSQFQSALNTKAERIKTAQMRKEKLLKRADSIEHEVQQQHAHLEALQDEKARLQADADAAAAQAAAERAAEQAAAAEATAAAQAAAAAEEEAAAAAKAAQQAAAPPAAEEAAEPHAETAEEIGRRIASQWTSDPAAAIPTNAEAEEMIHQEEDMEPLDEGEEDDLIGEHEDEGYNPDDVPQSDEHDHEHDHHHGHHHGYDSHHHHHHGEDHNPASPLNLAASKVSEAEARLKQLEKEAVDAHKLSTTKFDFGPDDQFLPLFGRTIIAHQTRWTYDVAFFETAHQREGSDNKVLIGKWKGWEHNYSEALFDNGDFCGAINAPRTFRVTLKCGLSEAFSDVEEASTCAYSSTFTSPLLCSEADVAAVQAQLSALEALEAEVLSEVNASAGKAGVKDEL